MKKLQYCILTILILFFPAGCSRQQSSETEMMPAEIAAAIMESQTELPALDQITSKDDDFILWISSYYNLPAEQVEDGIICYADDVEASEIAVFVLKEEKDCNAAEKALTEYIQNRAGVFEGYAPEQAALAKNGTVAANRNYVALLICPDTSAAKAAFLNCFGESTENNAYDSEAVLKAWSSGDDSSLSDVNRRILDAAKDVIRQEIRDDMTDYEKELAIHDWITGWSSFDYHVFGRSSSDGFAPGSDTPYGVLIDRSAMCHGYSSTFQLFMDMLDIECMTVFGIPGGNGVEHSWNMVKLDDEWYCVDAAWDDPIGGSPCHTYFNVTSQYLRDSGIHRWEEGSVPEATATDYAYGSH